MTRRISIATVAMLGAMMLLTVTCTRRAGGSGHHGVDSGRCSPSSPSPPRTPSTDTGPNRYWGQGHCVGNNDGDAAAWRNSHGTGVDGCS